MPPQIENNVPPAGSQRNLKKRLILIVLTILIVLAGAFSSWYFFSFSHKEEPVLSYKLKNQLRACDEEQAVINMPTIPRCYFEAFKAAGWTSEEILTYFKQRPGTKNIENLIKENEFWKEAWEEYVAIPSDNNELADWQTYQNEEYGFEFKYPNDWKMAERDVLVDNFQGSPLYSLGECSPYAIGAINNKITIDGGGEEGGYGYGNSIQVGMSDFSNSPVIYFEEYGSTTGINISNIEKFLLGDESVKDKICVDFPECWSDLSEKRSTFSGKPVFYNNKKFLGGPCDGGPERIAAKENFALYEFLSNGKYLSFLVNTKPNEKATFDQILSTFKFIEPGQLENQTPPVVGGDRDAHGCIGSAGYQWCENKQKCLRIWEEPCGTGQFCGGIGGVACPVGYTCSLEGTYPDAGGTCTIQQAKQAPDTACIQVVTPARNKVTGELHDFPTPCDVPAGWEAIK